MEMARSHIDSNAAMRRMRYLIPRVQIFRRPDGKAENERSHKTDVTFVTSPYTLPTFFKQWDQTSSSRSCHCNRLTNQGTQLHLVFGA